MIDKSIEGHCEMRGGLHRNTIFVYEKPINGRLDFMWYTDGYLNELSHDWDDYMRMTDGKLYLTLQDYKHDKFVDLNAWKNNVQTI